jgi:hypothetical protein
MFGGVGCGKTMLMDLLVASAPKEFQVGRIATIKAVVKPDAGTVSAGTLRFVPAVLGQTIGTRPGCVCAILDDVDGLASRVSTKGVPGGPAKKQQGCVVLLHVSRVPASTLHRWPAVLRYQKGVLRAAACH